MNSDEQPDEGIKHRGVYLLYFNRCVLKLERNMRTSKAHIPHFVP